MSISNNHTTPYRMVMAICIALIITTCVPGKTPASAQMHESDSLPGETSSAAAAEIKPEDIGNLYSSRDFQIVVGKDGIPVVVFWEPVSHLKILRREGGTWKDLKATYNCTHYRIGVFTGLGVDDAKNVFYAYSCAGSLYDDLRIAIYDYAKKEWTHEVIDAAPMWGMIRGVSLVVANGTTPVVSYSTNGELRYATRIGTDDWSIGKPDHLGSSTGYTSIGTEKSIAYRYSYDGKSYVAVAEGKGSEALISTSIAEGSLVDYHSPNRVGVLRQTNLYFGFRDKAGGAYILDFVTDRVSRSRLIQDESFGGPNALFAFGRNNGVTVAIESRPISNLEENLARNFLAKQIITGTRYRLGDIATDSSDRLHLLLTDNIGSIYYATTSVPIFVDYRRSRISSPGIGTSINNNSVKAGENKGFIDGDRVTTSPYSEKVSLNAACVDGFVELLALQVKPRLPKRFQNLSSKQIAFYVLVANPKLLDLLKEACKEEASTSVADHTAADASTDIAAATPYFILDFEYGAIQASPQHADFVLDVRTPRGTVRIAGASSAIVAHDSDANISFVHVTKGSARVTPADTSIAPFTLTTDRAAELNARGVTKEVIPPPVFLPYMSQ